MPAVLLQVILVLGISGIVLWAITQFPIDATIAKLIKVIIIVVVGIWALYLLVGILGGGPVYPVLPLRR